MAENSQAQERTEQPTPKKLQDARDKGDVPRSRELNTAATMLAALLGLLVLGPGAVRSYRGFVIDQFSISRDRLLSASEVVNSLAGGFIQGLLIIAPFLALLFLVTLCTPMIMGGWVFSFSLIRIDFSKMDPLKGIKRVFGIQGVIELIKAILKFALLGTIAVLVFKSLLFDYLALGQMDNALALEKAFRLVFIMLGSLVLVLVVMAVVDAPIQIIQFANKMRMTKQEIKDENKESSGNPEVKQKIRSLQQSVANRRMLLDVPDANVIIINPTHYAVALQYSEDNDAPKVLAKGVDHMAMRIREIGKTANVEIFSAPQLARSIYNHSKVGESIPTELYLAVAQVLAYVFQLQNSSSENARNLQAPTDLFIPEALRDSE